EISKNVPAHIPIVGDAKKILPKLMREYRALETDSSRLAGWGPVPDGGRETEWSGLEGWGERLNGWQEKYPLTYEDSTDGEVKPQYMIEAMAEVAPNAIITSDVGQHQMWAAQRFPFMRPRQWLNSGGLGTMRFCLASAI